jgi:anti-sigma regulatory factor (Ser/Thr protein kinase)
MEAAKPAPDRWRTIAKWLGISMTALLLAEELIDHQEAIDADGAAATGGLSSDEWDVRSDASLGDYFSQERAMIADQARAGNISSVEAVRLDNVLSRVQGIAMSSVSSSWHPGQFRKRFPADLLAPRLARSALATTAIGIPVEAFDTAALVTSELVTNSVRHSHSEWVEVDIALGANVLRIAVSDQSSQTIRPRTPDLDGGWGLTLVGELASRWGVERRSDGKTIWVELDLSPSAYRDPGTF